ncbi:hypothetical protein N482_02120 [Pseudoalteromonas luteoviolacea NCIMB 1942]|uniref:Uncharacterized protein n=1 Tax=Pseudoalteromonas luteoviolacea NCIMB 1942 TaxID=1365253 RepID=A0A167BYA4_9GAMM|nr:hypothetical protein N482_02120 [Pseudoalteromonas luteoviolacea NCIMB 1942]
MWSIIRRIVHWPLKRTLIASFAVLGLVFNVIKLVSYKTIVYHQVWYQELNMTEFLGLVFFSFYLVCVDCNIFHYVIQRAFAKRA